jgi:hypothetical protein
VLLRLAYLAVTNTSPGHREGRPDRYWKTSEFVKLLIWVALQITIEIIHRAWGFRDIVHRRCVDQRIAIPQTATAAPAG